MNQRADSWKKNFQAIVAKPLIYQRGWLLSHTLALQQGRKSNRTHACRESSRDSPLRARPICVRFHPGGSTVGFCSIGTSCANKKSPNGSIRTAAAVGSVSDANVVGRQVASGLTGFLGFRGLTLTGLRAVVGLMLRGFPTLTEVTSVAGWGLKNARQPGVSWDLF